jgi:hypothetical protein
VRHRLRAAAGAVVGLALVSDARRPDCRSRRRGSGQTANHCVCLRSGQVWADGRAMSRKDFDAPVADKC